MIQVCVVLCHSELSCQCVLRTHKKNLLGPLLLPRALRERYGGHCADRADRVRVDAVDAREALRSHYRKVTLHPLVRNIFLQLEDLPFQLSQRLLLLLHIIVCIMR